MSDDEDEAEIKEYRGVPVIIKNGMYYFYLGAIYCEARSKSYTMQLIDEYWDARKN